VKLFSEKEKFLQLFWVLSRVFAVYSQTFAKNVSRNETFAVSKSVFAVFELNGF